MSVLTEDSKMRRDLPAPVTPHVAGRESFVSRAGSLGSSEVDISVVVVVSSNGDGRILFTFYIVHT